MLKIMYMKLRKSERGFVLPTIVLASVVLMMVLGAALSVASSNTSALRSLYYNKLAQEAGESGLAMAEACLAQNNYQAQWTDATPLRPNTSCGGGAACADDASCYVVDNDNIRSTYSVGLPTTDSNGFQRVVVNANVATINSVGVARTVSSQALVGTFGAQVSFQKVTFGYVGNTGAFFGVIDASGQIRTVGYNGDGQLGNGTTVDTLTPSSFSLPLGKRAVGLYTSFLSVGRTMIAITADGDAYGAGLNSSGQLGIGTTSTSQSTPVRFMLPGSVKALYAGTLSGSTFVIGDDYNIYAAGACTNGQLGTGSSCTTTSTPVRVALPTVNASDANTLPVTASEWTQSTNMAADRNNVYVRMQGGRVYGWGTNNQGQLVNGTTTDSSTPIQIGTFGNSGQTKATQVAFDGDNVYILDSNGDVYAGGYNIYGSLAGAPAPMKSSTGFCIDNPNNDTAAGNQIRIWNCNNSTGQRIEWYTDGTIRFHPNSSTTLCIDNSGSKTTNGNPIQTWGCNGSGAQQWRLLDDGSLYNPASGKCIDNPNNSSTSGTKLQLYTCNSSAAQAWGFDQLVVLSKVPIPSSAGSVTRITTDQWSVLFLTSSGQVWGAGANNSGQLGNGSTNVSNPMLTQYILPAGRTATDVYTTRYSTYTANTFVVLDDGSVYGSGTNNYGQLGSGVTSALEATPQKMSLPLPSHPTV